MRATLTIALKEFRGYFIAPMAYVVVLFFLGVSGLIFVLTMAMPQAATNHYRGVMQSMVFITLMMAPVLTMSLLALERGRGTLELLMTRPVSDWSIVLGKYLAAVMIYTGLLIVTLLYPLLMSVGGEVEWGTILSGYVGMFCAGLAFMGIGLFGSAITADQIAAALSAFFILLFFWIMGFVAQSVPSGLGDVLNHLSFIEGYLEFAKGVIDLKNVVYFLSLAGFFVFLAERVVESRRSV
ncbi:MAG: ABC transporter permease subunit [candidate division WS1 bacterium]|jgi:ABC-2 type transport system permease protein|nr:ABC transporter permease subunit [candidate division WS1 bacterium]